MFAVFRENIYPADVKLAEHPDFQEFQRLHSDRPGYAGTVVAEIGDGRYLSITLWKTEADMQAAREALGPVVGRLLEPLMSSPSNLLGTGKIVFNDLTLIP